MANWTSDFEQYPSGGMIGSVSCLAMRNVKSAFAERFSPQHYLDESASPTCYHLVGKCSICDVIDTTPTSTGVDGAMAFDKTAVTIYRDNSLSMESFATEDHGGLANLTEDDHTQYLLTAGDDIIDIETPGVEGLSQIIGNYADEDVLAYGLHNGAGVHTGLVMDGSGSIRIGADAFDLEGHTVYDSYGSGNPVKNVIVGRCAFAPFSGSSIYIYLLPAFAASPPDDYVSKMSLKWGSSGDALIECYRFAS